VQSTGAPDRAFGNAVPHVRARRSGSRSSPMAVARAPRGRGCACTVSGRRASGPSDPERFPPVALSRVSFGDRSWSSASRHVVAVSGSGARASVEFSTHGRGPLRTWHRSRPAAAAFPADGRYALSRRCTTSRERSDPAHRRHRQPSTRLPGPYQCTDRGRCARLRRSDHRGVISALIGEGPPRGSRHCPRPAGSSAAPNRPAAERRPGFRPFRPRSRSPRGAGGEGRGRARLARSAAPVAAASLASPISVNLPAPRLPVPSGSDRARR
jgi:hypothetical protein